MSNASPTDTVRLPTPQLNSIQPADKLSFRLARLPVAAQCATSFRAATERAVYSMFAKLSGVATPVDQVSIFCVG
jgi:hypothetical protein